ncbi:hypothetical protein [Wukongibacter sp. M2B1]|uniref:hypothetical protein n=1 Tax=Wukongibacter sp. M2B1 TaxID=3088895 RepID=UPI003D7A49E6
MGENFGICDIDFPLSMFSNYKKEAENRYLEYVTDTKIDREIDYKMVLKEEININDEIKEKTENKSLDNITNDIEKMYKDNIDDLRGRSKSRYVSEIKKNFIHEVLKYKLMGQKELVEYFNITEMVISKIAYKV